MDCWRKTRRCARTVAACHRVKAGQDSAAGVGRSIAGPSRDLPQALQRSLRWMRFTRIAPSWIPIPWRQRIVYATTNAWQMLNGYFAAPTKHSVYRRTRYIIELKSGCAPKSFFAYWRTMLSGACAKPGVSCCLPVRISMKSIKCRIQHFLQSAHRRRNSKLPAVS